MEVTTHCLAFAAKSTYWRQYGVCTQNTATDQGKINAQIPYYSWKSPQWPGKNECTDTTPVIKVSRIWTLHIFWPYLCQLPSSQAFLILIVKNTCPVSQSLCVESSCTHCRLAMFSILVLLPHPPLPTTTFTNDTMFTQQSWAKAWPCEHWYEEKKICIKNTRNYK